MSALADLRTNWRETTPAVLLFAPGNSERKLAKVAGFGADGVILDLEDAVPVDEKVATRAIVREAAAGMDDRLLRLVRVNNADTGLSAGDVAAVVSPGVDGIVYPKVEDEAELWEIDRQIAAAEAEAGMAVGRTLLIALIETAVGISRVDDILARVPDRLLTVGFGIGDYSVDMSLELGDYGSILDYPRSRLAVAARAAGLARPLDGPWLRLQDLDGLDADCLRSRALGFGGRQVIYPAHVEPAMRRYLGFDEEQLERFARIVAGFEQAIAEGSAALQIDGELVDYPIYHRARRSLAAAQRLTQP